MRIERFLRYLAITIIIITAMDDLETFYTAFRSEDKAVTVYVNNYGEANLEAFLVCPLVFLSIGYLISDMILEIKRNDKHER